MIKNPILIDLPMPIQTKRLTLRPVMPGDGKEIFQCIEESRDQFRLWMTWVDSVKTWEDSECTARQFYADFLLRKNMPLVVLQNERLIGMCGFHLIHWNVPSAIIGYWCRQSAQGQGFTQEALAALTQYGFKIMHLKRLSILCDDENIASIRVAEATGYTLEARAKGLLANLRGNGLAYSRCYVCFDSEETRDNVNNTQ